jgi:hypothetical protein
MISGRIYSSGYVIEDFNQPDHGKYWKVFFSWRSFSSSWARFFSPGLLSPRNVKAQAYYSRINHAMRHPEDLDVLEAEGDVFGIWGTPFASYDLGGLLRRDPEKNLHVGFQWIL